jgi:hypothetical protein
MASALSNHFKFQLLNALSAHTFKLILMANGFVFNKDTHATLADVTASQLAPGNGYTGAITLANIAVAEDDMNDKSTLTADDVVITASGGIIGPTPGAIVYDDTMSDDSVAGYIDFNSNQSIADGAFMAIRDIAFNLT